MTESLNWGLLSTAHINRKLIPAIRETPRAELVSVASRSQSRASQYAAEWNIPRAHGSYEALLEDPDVDVVYVSLPNSFHAEWTVKALESGKHVLCEKPLALSVAECDQIIQASQASRVIAMEAVMYLYHPILHKAREMVRQGAVGEITMVRGSFSFLLDRPDDVRWDPTLGGGSLWDIGSYPVSFIRWIAGAPDRVSGWQTPSSSGVDATFAGMLRYDDELLGVFDCSFREPFRNQAEVAGTGGRMVIEHSFLVSEETRLLLYDPDGDAGKEVAVAKRDAYHSEVKALTAAILDDASLAVPLISSRANVATLNALYESARRGEPRPVSGT